MPRRIHQIDFARHAARYRVSTRTARRWHAKGADLNNPETVGTLLLRQSRRKGAAALAVAELLTDTNNEEIER